MAAPVVEFIYTFFSNKEGEGSWQVPVGNLLQKSAFHIMERKLHTADLKHSVASDDSFRCLIGCIR